LGPLLLAEAPTQGLAAVRADVGRRFDTVYEGEYLRLMRDKLGLLTPDAGDELFVKDLFDTMASCSTDFTDTFRALTRFAGGEMREADVELLVDQLVARSAKPETIVSSLRRKIRISRPSMPPQQTMYIWELLQSDPDKVREIFVAPIDELRVDIEAEKRKLDGLIEASQQVERMKTLAPADKESTDRISWSGWVKKYQERLQLEDGVDVGARRADRADVQRRANPTFILRNWIAQEAIADAEKGSFGGVNTVLRMLSQPYLAAFDNFDNLCSAADCSGGSDDSTGGGAAPDTRRFLGPGPDWAASLICTCSS